MRDGTDASEGQAVRFAYADPPYVGHVKDGVILCERCAAGAAKKVGE